MKIANVINLSGGKDSTAILLLALNKHTENLIPVFADTGNEHPITYDYLEYLERILKISITRVKANFDESIKKKREITLNKWRADGIPGWIIDLAEKTLHPTGIPFLDLCLWKGRFPSSKSQFCTEELKVQPITDQVIWPLLKTMDRIESWQGIRWDESLRRSKYIEREGIEPDSERVFAYRPILNWKASDVFHFHFKNGIKPNPLYKQGMGRVGCMPCIHENKNGLKNISKRFPEVIERIAQWEHLVSLVSKRQSSTFFRTANDPTINKTDVINYKDHGIDRMVEWANTSRGGRQTDMEDLLPPSKCASIYGLCE